MRRTEIPHAFKVPSPSSGVPEEAASPRPTRNTLLRFLRLEERSMRMSVIEWLLDSDPSIRWQVMRDLIAESDATVARERSRVAAEGWGARLLDLQGSDGHWGGAAFVPHAWISTKDTLQLLRDLGVDPTSDRVRRAIDQVRDRCT